MPDIGIFHPQLVHFVVALGIVGVGFRLLSLTGKFEWSRTAGAVLLILASGAALAAAQSGHDAHGPVERVPGAREAVHEHEELGEKTRNVFLLVGVLELAALVVAKRPALQRGLYAVSAVAGLVACYFLYEAAEHGGELVYSYAGGVGIRSGDPEDVTRLLIAGLYNQAREARQAGRADEAARLTEELARQAPNDNAVALLAAESKLRDRHDPAAALAALDAIAAPADDQFFAMRKSILAGEALVAAGQRDSARALLTALSQKYPDSRFVKSALEKLQ